MTLDDVVNIPKPGDVVTKGEETRYVTRIDFEALRNWDRKKIPIRVIYYTNTSRVSRFQSLKDWNNWVSK